MGGCLDSLDKEVKGKGEKGLAETQYGAGTTSSLVHGADVILTSGSPWWAATQGKATAASYL